jgi:dTDP-4-amino-4,6-dideoxygalactose transaminase
MDTSQTYMGGMFGSMGLHYEEQPLPHFLEEPYLELINGRSGIRVLCELLKPKVVWMPSYLCHSLIEPILNCWPIQFYPVGQGMRISNLDWCRNVSQEDLVVFIDYFGFDLHREAIQAVKERGARVLQDAAQALLSTFDRPHADFVLFSPRKTIGVADGGILQSKCDESFSDVSLKEAPSKYLMAAYNAFWSRTKFDQTGIGDWFQSYQDAEKLIPIGNYQMTDLSSASIRHGIDYQLVAQQRRKNYSLLYEELGDCSILGDLPPNVVPLGFPVVCENRDALLKKLYSKNIFCPVHWPMRDSIVPDRFKEAYQLSETMLTLLSDQRMNEDQINLLLYHIKDYL